jgi:hypothetical protein
MGGMSREKYEKIENLVKIFVFIGLLQQRGEPCFLHKKPTGKVGFW